MFVSCLAPRISTKGCALLVLLGLPTLDAASSSAGGGFLVGFSGSPAAVRASLLEMAPLVSQDVFLPDLPFFRLRFLGVSLPSVAGISASTESSFRPFCPCRLSAVSSARERERITSRSCFCPCFCVGTRFCSCSGACGCGCSSAVPLIWLPLSLVPS